METPVDYAALPLAELIRLEKEVHEEMVVWRIRWYGHKRAREAAARSLFTRPGGPIPAPTPARARQLHVMWKARLYLMTGAMYWLERLDAKKSLIVEARRAKEGEQDGSVSAAMGALQL